MGKAICTPRLTRCVPIAPCDCVNKQVSDKRAHIASDEIPRSVVFDFQLSLSVWMHLSGRVNINNNGDI